MTAEDVAKLIQGQMRYILHDPHISKGRKLLMIEQFRKCLHDEGYLSGLHYYGTFDGEKLIGEIAIRPDRKHICFFFVDGRYHRRGIGTRMFRRS